MVSQLDLSVHAAALPPTRRLLEVNAMLLATSTLPQLADLWTQDLFDELTVRQPPGWVGRSGCVCMRSV